MTTTLSPALTVNEVLRLAPDAVVVFNRLGIDTCCGGGQSLQQAAEAARIPLARLMTAVHALRAWDGAGVE